MEKKGFKYFIRNNETFVNAFITFIVSLFLLVVLYFWHDNNTLVGWINITFSSGIIVLFFGLLIYITGEGTFDYLVFSMKSFGRLFMKAKKRETYLEYVASKDRSASKKSISVVYGSFPLLLVSIILMLVYYL